MTEQELGELLDAVSADIQSCRDDLHALDITSARGQEELNAVIDRLGTIKGLLRDVNPVVIDCVGDELVAREDATT